MVEIYDAMDISLGDIKGFSVFFASWGGVKDFWVTNKNVEARDNKVIICFLHEKLLLFNVRRLWPIPASLAWGKEEIKLKRLLIFLCRRGN